MSAPLNRFDARLGRWRGLFDPRDGSTDLDVINEVWTRNDYRIDTHHGLRGTVIDAGANIGAFSVLAAKAGASRVIALEPQSENRALCEYHCAVNRVEDRVELMTSALVGRRGRGLATISGTGGGAHIDDAAEWGDDMNQAPCLTLEALLENAGPVSLLKCDIEGGEFEAFEYLPVERLQSVERIAMEWHGPHMPHLTHLLNDNERIDWNYPIEEEWARQVWGPLLAKLADAGRVETIGHPWRGGLLYWRRY